MYFGLTSNPALADPAQWQEDPRVPIVVTEQYSDIELFKKLPALVIVQLLVERLAQLQARLNIVVDVIRRPAPNVLVPAHQARPTEIG